MENIMKWFFLNIKDNDISIFTFTGLRVRKPTLYSYTSKKQNKLKISEFLWKHQKSDIAGITAIYLGEHLKGKFDKLIESESGLK